MQKFVLMMLCFVFSYEPPSWDHHSSCQHTLGNCLDILRVYNIFRIQWYVLFKHDFSQHQHLRLRLYNAINPADLWFGYVDRIMSESVTEMRKRRSMCWLYSSIPLFLNMYLKLEFNLVPSLFSLDTRLVGDVPL